MVRFFPSLIFKEIPTLYSFSARRIFKWSNLNSIAYSNTLKTTKKVNGFSSDLLANGWTLSQYDCKFYKSPSDLHTCFSGEHKAQCATSHKIGTRKKQMRQYITLTTIQEYLKSPIFKLTNQTPEHWVIHHKFKFLPSKIWAAEESMVSLSTGQYNWTGFIQITI